MAIQGSLFDTGGVPALGVLDGDLVREELGDGAWVEHRPGWVTGTDAVFEYLLTEVPWRAERRKMYDRIVDVPRLVAFYGEDERLPHPFLDEVRSVLAGRYGGEEGGPVRTAGLCLYRGGGDSVAWHGDTIGRGATHDTVVAIVSFGEPRRLLLRPRGAPAGGSQASGPGGGPARRYELGHGDLIVMGGTCQRTWEHAVPKTRRSVGPRISVQFRQPGVR